MNVRLFLCYAFFKYTSTFIFILSQFLQSQGPERQIDGSLYL